MNVLNKIFTERVRRLLLVLGLVFCCFLPVFIICDIHVNLLLSKTQMTRETIKYITIMFVLMIIIGTILGLVFCALFDLFGLIFGLLFLEVLANVILIIFSFVDTHHNYRLIITLLFIGLLVGMIQITITSYYGNQYEDNDKYTLLHHYILYTMIILMACHTSRYIMPDENSDRTKHSLHDSFMWKFMLILACNLIALVLMFNLIKAETQQTAQSFNINRIKNIDCYRWSTICLFYCPLIIFGLGVRLLEKRWMLQCENLNPSIGSFCLACRYHVSVIQPIIAILCIVILLFLFKIDPNDAYRIKLGCCFIIIGAILSSFIDWGMKDCFHQYNEVGKNNARLRLLLNDGADIHTSDYQGPLALTDDINCLTYYSLIDIVTIWEAYNQTNMTSPSDFSITATRLHLPDNVFSIKINLVQGAETWIIYSNWAGSSIGNDIYFVHPHVYRRPSSLPILFLAKNIPSSVDAVQLVSDHLNITISNNYFNELLENEYEIRVKDELWGKLWIQRGGFYVLFMLKEDDSLHLATVIIIPPYQFNVLWMLPQYIFVTMGKIILVSSALNMSYSLPSSNIKCETIVVFFFIYDIGYLVYVIIYELTQSNLLARAVILPILLIVATCYLHFCEFSLDYKLLPSGTATNIDAEQGVVYKKGKHL